jgi:hypothetical protein
MQARSITGRGKRRNFLSGEDLSLHIVLCIYGISLSGLLPPRGEMGIDACPVVCIIYAWWWCIRTAARIFA